MARRDPDLEHWARWTDSLYGLQDWEVARLLEEQAAGLPCTSPLFPLLVQAAERLRRADGGTLPRPR
jgi:hypothetical protein